MVGASPFAFFRHILTTEVKKLKNGSFFNYDFVASLTKSLLTARHQAGYERR